MSTYFLPREVGSFESGSQIFTRINTQNTAFTFTKETVLDPIGLLNSVLLQNAGVNDLNGTFDYVTLFEEKPYYVKGGDPDYFIIFFENKWEIYNFKILNGLPVYYSDQNVLYPWNVTSWISSNIIYNPVPTVTKVS
jgi:hypothetical protein